MQASEKGDYQTVQKLIQGGSNINEADSNGSTPLMYAITEGKTEVVKYLIESGADIKARNKNGYDALLCAVDAVDHMQLEIVKILINKGANLESKDLWGRTPLVLAAFNVAGYGLPHADVIKLLIESGADLNAKSAEGETALDLALSYKRGDIVDDLIRAGVKLWTPEAAKARLFFVGIQLWDYATVTVGKQSKNLNKTGMAFIDVDTGIHNISVSGESTASIDAIAGQTYYLEVTQDMKRRSVQYLILVKMPSFGITFLKEVEAKEKIKELLNLKRDQQIPSPPAVSETKGVAMLQRPSTRPSVSSANEIKRDGRFIAYDNGTVLDTRTGLMWAVKDNGSDVGWKDAKSYCENYREGGYTDWRMPTQDELEGLYDAGKTYKADCGVNVHLTELIRPTCTAPWASETRGTDAAYFSFGLGIRQWSLQSFGYSFRALPVRSGK